ncbi:MAG: cytochrome c3 family protein [Planctomycetota bacterium]|jgi:hypothetical protein
MLRPPKTLLWLAPVTMLACAVAIRSAALQAETPRPTVNHAAHKARDLVCSDCHDPEETGEPKLPDPEGCFECHEDLTQEPERVQAYFDAVRQEDGSYRFERPAYMPGLIVNHKGHAEYEVDCASCHSEPSEKAFARPQPLAFMQACMACHEQRRAPNECATCHKETRADVKPASHDAAFLRVHGAQAPAGWREGEGESCAICHEVPADCHACHAQSKPRSHAEAGFRLHHGRGDTDARDGPFAETSCALCHKEQSCVVCHQTTMPRSHTSVWRRRLHGIAASIERQSCQTCHKQDVCVRCHESTEPVSHRGTWGTGPQAHCLACHDPLQSTGCFACHKNTLGHLTATPLPAGLPHSAATDCRTCHSVLPHFDDGGNCRRCHR